MNKELPYELIIHILSFLEKKFINFKCKKCICKTLKKKICKINTNHIYCHVHRDFDFFHKLSFSQICKQYKCRMCEKNCMNDLFYIFNLGYFCSEKCKNSFILKN